MSQGALQVPTAEPGSAGGQTSNMAILINAGLLALATLNSGASTPENGPISAPVKGQQWLDTTTAAANVVSLYDGASWLPYLTVDTVAHTIGFTGTVPLSATSTMTGGPGTVGVKSTSGLLLVGGFVTPQQYGCAGDGTTDDTANLSACLNSGNPVLLIGKFKVTSAITVTLDKTTGPFGSFVQGMGFQASQILLANTAASITINISYSGNGTTSTQVVWRDLNISPTVANQGSSTVGALNLIGSAQSGSTAPTYELTNVCIIPDDPSAHYSNVGILLKDVRNGLLQRPQVSGYSGTLTGSGIVFWSSAANSAPVDCHIIDPQCTFWSMGIELRPYAGGSAGQTNDWEGVRITGGTIISCQTGIKASSVDNSSNWLSIDACNFGCGTAAVDALNVQNVFIKGCYAIMENVGSVPATTYGFKVAMTNGVECYASIIGNNVFFAYTTPATRIDVNATNAAGTTYDTVGGNVSIGATTTTITAGANTFNNVRH